MKRIEDAKKKYEEIPIPEELSKRVSEEIQTAQQRRKKITALWRFRRYGAVAAALVVVFTAGLNTSVTFAKAAGDLPIIGELAQVLTFRSYENETEDLKIAVDIPSIDMISEDFNELETSVNEEIHKLCQDFADQAVKRAEEYRKAFLDTGGTEEEWEAHNLEVKVWYEVKTQTEDYLSLEIMGSENWNSAGFASRYYNFDLKNGKQLILQDVLGDDYKEMARTQILEQMKAKEESGTVFFQDALPEITEETPFYMNADGNPVLVFDKYELAPGSEGIQEFTVNRN
ncbi:MAG: DUF3298 domain-containing protein [Lachnospiraceae bacterium]|jgi:hypothetical protein